jgi:hypothetical protein
MNEWEGLGVDSLRDPPMRDAQQCSHFGYCEQLVVESLFSDLWVSQ